MGKLYACAILIDDKIYAWKVSDRPWQSKYHATMYCPWPDGYMRLETKEFITGSILKTNVVYEKLAPEWFSQWIIHPEFRGFKPYRENEVKNRMP